MRYVVAGYVVILSLLAVYAVQLVWRRRTLRRAVARVTSAAEGATTAGGPAGAPAGVAVPDPAGAPSVGLP